MCTCATYATKDQYFGRNLDLEYSYNETVTVTPRNFPLTFRKEKTIDTHPAIIGMAFVNEGYPLYYDATNEYGLSMAGLNFPGNGYFTDPQNDKDNIAPFEFIPWILGQCRNLSEARTLLSRINLVNIPFSDSLPITPLHWMIADQNGSVVVESVKDGIHVYDNPVGVMTNNPPFPLQMFALNNYPSVSRKQPENTFADVLKLDSYSRGMGGLGIPGDLSSQSRFVKVAFTKLNSVSKSDEKDSVSQFFHILGSVDQQKGCCLVRDDEYEITIYTSCCNLTKGIYYYTTYNNHQITAVDMNKENLDGDSLIRFPVIQQGEVRWQN